MKKPTANPLHDAIDRDDINGVRYALENGAGAKDSLHGGLKPMHRACAQDKRTIAVLLLEYGADYYDCIQDHHGNFLDCMDVAVSECRASMVKLLIRKGYKWEKHRGTINALDIASSIGDRNLVGVLLKVGAPVNGGANLRQPIFWAVQAGDARVVKALLDGGADPCSIELPFSEDLNTPLHAAAAIGRCKVIEVLLASGARIDARNRGGDTPLHSAVTYKNVNAGGLLLQHGADPDVRNSAGVTPRLLARKRGLLRKLGLTVQRPERAARR